MSIIGLWKVKELNVVEVNKETHSITRTWRTSEDIAADGSVNPMQKAFAQSAYKFEEDGTVLSLMPKAIVPEGEGEAYDDEFVIAKRTQWKEENGKLFLAAEENGELDWQEMIPAGDGFEVLGYQRIQRA